VTAVVHGSAAPAAESALPPELLKAATRLADGLAAVFGVNGISDQDASDGFGDLWMRCVQLTAINWRRSGPLGSDGAPTVGGVVHSERVVAPTVDALGRVNPGNLLAVLGQVRRFHPGVALAAGLITWTVPTDVGSFLEVAVPGDFVVETVDGYCRTIHPGEG
jgi:hypothetical protein